MTIAISVFGFILGVSLGSFLKVLADRSLGKKSFWGRSFCPNCKHKLSVFDLVPIFSYISLRSRCRYCKKKIPVEYLLVELFSGFLIGFLAFLKIPSDFLELAYFDQSLIGLNFIFNTFIIIVLLTIVLTDLKKGLIPDRITFPSLKIAFFYLILLSAFKVYLLYSSLSGSPIGKYLLPPDSDYFYRHALISMYPLLTGLTSAFFIGLFFALIIILTKGRGMGGGDLKLGIFLGLVFGFPFSVLSLMLAFFTGSIVGVILLLFRKRKFGQTIPFGPFMSLGGVITIFWGDLILKWYLNLSLM